MDKAVTQVLPVDDPQALRRAATLLLAGEVVAAPTETVYGLAADATNPAAVARIFEAKGRPAHDPLIVHTASTQAAFDLWAQVPPVAQKLAVRFWPGPLTLVGPLRPGAVVPAVSAGLNTLAVRVSAHPGFLALLKEVGRPLAAPSANPFSAPSPTRVAHVLAGLGGRIPLVLDGGPCAVGLESTVVSVVGGPRVLRLGGIPLEALEAVTGVLPVQLSSSRPSSPGQLTRHYAPKTPLVLWQEGQPWPALGERAGWGVLCPLAGQLAKEALEGFETVVALDVSDNLENAAVGLFEGLYVLDRANLKGILAVLAPEKGVGRAINDRLRRASKK